MRCHCGSKVATAVQIENGVNRPLLFSPLSPHIMDGERSKRASGEGAIKLNVAVRPSDGATGGLQVRVRTKKRRQSQLRRGFDLGAVRANFVNGLARSTAFPPPLLPLLSCRRRWPDLLSIFRSYADGRGRPFLPSPSVPPSHLSSLRAQFPFR